MPLCAETPGQPWNSFSRQVHTFFNLELCISHLQLQLKVSLQGFSHFIGKTKAIGVSNYTIKHLEELMAYATVKPHVLQVHNKLLHDFCPLNTHIHCRVSVTHF